MRVAGVVSKQPLDTGSKSERLAVVLQSDDGARFVLRRRGGNPFSDPILEGLVGRRLAFEGVVHGTTLIISDWTGA